MLLRLNLISPTFLLIILSLTCIKVILMNADLLKDTIHIHAEASELSCGFSRTLINSALLWWHESGKLHINKTIWLKKKKKKKKETISGFQVQIQKPRISIRFTVKSQYNYISVILIITYLYRLFFGFKSNSLESMAALRGRGVRFSFVTALLVYAIIADAYLLWRWIWVVLWGEKAIYGLMRKIKNKHKP